MRALLTRLEEWPTFPEPFLLKNGVNIEMQFLTLGTAEQGLHRECVRRGSNMQNEI